MKKATSPEEQSRPRKADSSTATPSKIARQLAHMLAVAIIHQTEREARHD